MYKLFKRTHYAGSMEIQMAGACDSGITRDHNEDAIALQEDDGRGYYLAIVCDGMGGHNAGEIASAIAVESISRYCAEHFDSTDPQALLEGAFLVASNQIDEQALINPSAKGMGCTAVVALGIKDRLFIAHAGDSRAYRLRDGKLEQITRDHTMIQEMLDNGLLSEEQAAVHPYRGRISRCLGHGKNKGDPTINEVEFRRGDDYLLCSDGLSDVLPVEEIAVLVGQREVRSSGRRLIDAANKAGGPDNVSAVIMRRMV